MHLLPKLSLMTSALQVMLPVLMFRTQMMSLTLPLPLLLMSSLARVATSASDPSASLEVCQLISHMCQNMWPYLVIARLLLECRNQPK